MATVILVRSLRNIFPTAQNTDRQIRPIHTAALQPVGFRGSEPGRQRTGNLDPIFRSRARTQRSNRWDVAWLTALKWVIGYGYYPQRSIYWAIGLVIMGAIVLRVSGEGPRNGMPFGLAYSFDTLLPIIKLRDRHYQIDLKT